jgi:hypothetical protein
LPKNSSQSLDVKENSFEKLMGSLPDDPYELER